MKDKNFTYINDYYKKNFSANKVVKALGKLGTLLYGDNYCWVKLEDGRIANFHPKDVELVEDSRK